MILPGYLSILCYLTGFSSELSFWKHPSLLSKRNVSADVGTHNMGIVPLKTSDHCTILHWFSTPFAGSTIAPRLTVVSLRFLAAEDDVDRYGTLSDFREFTQNTLNTLE